MEDLFLVGRQEPLFENDLKKLAPEIAYTVGSSRFLIVGGGGTIGQSVTKKIFEQNPRCLHVVDISENNLVELVRDLRSSFGYIDGEFKTFCLDSTSQDFEIFLRNQGHYDFVFNLSALKHVRSEKDPYTLMRMIDINVINAINIQKLSSELGFYNYFCVSTDKAANPVNLMGASKLIMEKAIVSQGSKIPVKMARFANVAFSDGSLLHGFRQRLQKNQPISAPSDVRRYFLSKEEAGELCLTSALFADSNEIFFPKPSSELSTISFSQVAENFLRSNGLEPIKCNSEQEARDAAKDLKNTNNWPVYFFESDTTGEKDEEEFFTASETPDFQRFENIGVIQKRHSDQDESIEEFLQKIKVLRSSENWDRHEIVEVFRNCLPELSHQETGKFLDAKM